MVHLINVITQQDFLAKPFLRINHKRLTTIEMPKLPLEEIVDPETHSITFGSGAPSTLIYPNAKMDPVQGEFKYENGAWYVYDGAVIDGIRRSSNNGMLILLPNYEKREYSAKYIGKDLIRKKIYPKHDLEKDGTIIIAPHLSPEDLSKPLPDEEKLIYLLRLDIDTPEEII